MVTNGLSAAVGKPNNSWQTLLLPSSITSMPRSNPWARQMRLKGALLLLVCILITSVFYCLLGDTKPSLNELVSETHRQLSHLKGVVAPQTQASEGPEEVNEKYLRTLGFVDKPRLFPDNVWTNVSLPVFVTAVTSTQIHLVTGFIKSLQEHLTDTTLLVYDLGLDDSEILSVSDGFLCLCVCAHCCLCYLV